MELIDSLAVSRDGAAGEIQLLSGDLTAIPDEHAVDLLVISAFHGSYQETPTSVIGGLGRRGLSVAELAREGRIDVRGSDCWLSRPVERPDLNFRQLLCFEPKSHGRPTQAAVGEMFRGLVPFVTGPPWISSVAMPLLATGDRGEDPLEMLRTIVEAAIHWLAAGLPLRVLKIVLYEGSKQADPSAAAAVFRSLAEKSTPVITPAGDYAHDLFVSYSRRDAKIVDSLVTLMRKLDPELKIFIDHDTLRTGSIWQRELFEALERSRKVLCLFSPDYLKSDVCQDEYQLALLRRRTGGVLLPVYLRSTELPLHMQLVQYRDCREEDPARLADLAREIVESTTGTAEVAAPPRPVFDPDDASTVRQTISTDALDIDISIRIRPADRT